MSKFTLAELGWSARFLAQLSTEEAQAPNVARIATVARDRIGVLAPDGALTVSPPSGHRTGACVTGDWVLLSEDRGHVARLLERQTLLSRRSAGDGTAQQLIAANVDTLGIVTSCNTDFNEARLERYLAMAVSAGTVPLIVLTKADMCDDPRSYAKRAERLSPLVTAVPLDATGPDAAGVLAPWAGAGQTLALVGSSGVGKTTLSNALTGRSDDTAGIREDDAKGRHTTTARNLLPTCHGGWLIDTPGMRSVPLVDAADGIAAVFSDIEDLAEGCRFSDCAHDTEPGCAILAAIAAGVLDQDRVRRFRKLLLEDAHNSASVQKAGARDRAFGKTARMATSTKDRKRR